MNEAICKSISDSELVGFVYNNEQRWVEPHTYGLQHNGNESLWAWQVTGNSGAGFRLFLLDQMSMISSGENFEGPRAGYTQSDERFAQIYAQL